MDDTVFETERLILRGWRDTDAVPFHAMFGDLRVMEHLRQPETLETVTTMIATMQARQAEFGYWFWAMEHKVDRAFMGFCGIKPGPSNTPIAAKPEIGWRLAYRYWGQGFAREAAEASLDWAWSNTSEETIWAITNPANTRSIGLMERIGMSRRRDLDFDHPHEPEGSALRAHVTYAVDRPFNLR